MNAQPNRRDLLRRAGLGAVMLAAGGAEALGSKDQWVALHAANALDNLDAKARPALDKMKATLAGSRGYVQRCLQKAVADLEK